MNCLSMIFRGVRPWRLRPLNLHGTREKPTLDVHACTFGFQLFLLEGETGAAFPSHPSANGKKEGYVGDGEGNRPNIDSTQPQ